MAKQPKDPQVGLDPWLNQAFTAVASGETFTLETEKNIAYAMRLRWYRFRTAWFKFRPEESPQNMYMRSSFAIVRQLPGGQWQLSIGQADAIGKMVKAYEDEFYKKLFGDFKVEPPTTLSEIKGE